MTKCGKCKGDLIRMTEYEDKCQQCGNTVYYEPVLGKVRHVKEKDVPYAFELFVKPKKMRPSASISKAGTIRIMRWAVEEHNLGDSKFASLYFDKRRKAVGIKFVTQKAININPRELIRISGNQHRHIPAKALFNHYGISLTKVQRFDMKFVEKGVGLFVINLMEPK